MTPLSPGDRLDRYELLCVLAQGGMGTVWLGRMTGKLGFARLVALKTILPSYSQDRQFCDMFLDEARIAAQLDHENVARILEIGEDRGLLYYAMELIDGESLRKLYRDVRAANQIFPMGVALRIIADACAGLHATHELRGPDGQPLEVVHRDVSPQNLLITIRGTTKLIDFGVAKANARRSEETEAGTLKGKLEYMAPEQARGEPLDRRADVYGLGAVLYELLGGRPVRDTDEGRQLLALHELMTGVPYPALPSFVPDIVRAIVDQALARDPRARFASAEALRQALEHAMVQIRQQATVTDVATVLAHFSRERTAKRNDAIERAVRAASEGRIEAQTVIAPLFAPMPSPQHPGASPGSALGTGPFAPQEAHGPIGFMGAGGSAPGNDGSQTGPSMRTIGAAYLSAHPPASSSATRIVAGVVVLGLVAVLGVVAAVIVTRQTERAAVTTAPLTPVEVSVGGATSSAEPVPVEPVAPGAATESVVPAVLVEAPLTTPPIAAPSDPAPEPPAAKTTSATTAKAPASAPAVTSAPAAGHTGKDVSAATAAPKRPVPPPKPPSKPTTKPGTSDEYGF